jgi:hypothetical protein
VLVGYEGELIRCASRSRNRAGGRLTDDQQTANLIHAHLRSRAERVNSLLKAHLQRPTTGEPMPTAVGAIAAAAFVQLHFEHDRTT